jgi:beta-phosphoglucomutase
MPQAVIFDMDGVLIDTYQAHFESWRRLAAEHGVVITNAEFARTFGRTSREIIAATWKAGSPDQRQIRALDDRKEALYREIVAERFPVMDGARELVMSLRAAGFRIGIGSSAPPENVQLALRHLGPALFDAVVNGRDVDRGKPDPQVFLLVASRLQVSPAACAVIEDASVGIEAANRAGMASVAFVSTGRTDEELLAAHPTLLIHSLAELTPAALSVLVTQPRTAPAAAEPSRKNA